MPMVYFRLFLKRTGYGTIASPATVPSRLLGVIFRPYGRKSTVPNGYFPSTTLTSTLTLNLTLTPTLTLNDP